MAPNPSQSEPPAPGWRRWLAWVGLLSAGAASFHVAQSGVGPGWLFAGFLAAWSAARLAPSARGCFYGVLALGIASYTPHLGFLWTIFGPAAVPLWLILPLWLATSALLLRSLGVRFGTAAAVWAAPWVWTGTEFLRSEVWWLRFSWLGAGGVSGSFVDSWGVYGSGFVLTALAAPAIHGLTPKAWTVPEPHPKPPTARFLRFAGPTTAFLAAVLMAAAGIALAGFRADSKPVAAGASVAVTGLQLEFPSDADLARGLDGILRDHPETRLVVLPEYTFEGPPPGWILDWCRKHSRWLIVGGKDWIDAPAPGGSVGSHALQSASLTPSDASQPFRNTAFVVSTNGEVVFRQAKSRPIQFFKDGLPATDQRLWESPWGPLGIAICYDASYRQVTDRLVRLGARALIFPTMDVEEWGPQEHRLNARQAALRAQEYRIPALRVASSGPSALHDAQGRIQASTPIGNSGQVLAGRLDLPAAPGIVPPDAFLAPACLLALVFLTALSVLKGLRLPGTSQAGTAASPVLSER